MGASQRYIGTPNGVVVCMDKITGVAVQGRLYHFYQTEPIPFGDVGQAFMIMEQLFERLQFPRATTSERSFREKTGGTSQAGSVEKVFTDQELSDHQGDIGTFIIRVQYRQNSSWQGRVTWMEENKTLSFRSTWELMKLMEDAIKVLDVHPADELKWFPEDVEQ